MKTRRSSQLASLAIAAAVSVGLAGCGGSSDNNDDTTGAQSSPPAKTAMTADIALSDAQKAALKAELKDSGDSETLKDGDVRVGVTFSCTSDDPCTITVSNSLGTIVATAHSTTSGTVSGTATGLEAPAIPAVSGAIATRLAYELVGGTQDGSDRGLPNRIGESGATHIAGLRQFGFPADSGLELKDPHHELDRDGDTEFAKSDTNPAGLDGWTGETWTTGNQIIVRYTNQNVETATDGTFRSQYGDKDGGSSDEYGVQRADWKHAESDDLPTGAKIETYQRNTPFSGTFAEVEGEFSCTAGACTLALNKDGEIVHVGTWIFTADDETSAVSYEKADSDYLAFGWWRQSTGTSHSGVEDFKVLYSGRKIYDDNSGVDDSLEGTAEYKGHAAGNYVKGAKGGEFVADAKIEIKFGDSTQSHTLDGTINNFEDSSGNSLGAWEVSVKDESADAGSNDLSYSGTAGSVNWDLAAGSINYYGERGTSGVLPTGVAGWFHATTNALDGDTTDENDATTWDDETDVAVAGAFAATR